MVNKSDNISALRASLSLISGISSEDKPNGCVMYKTVKGLVINTYDTGKVVFQGNEKDGKEDKEKIEKAIEEINKNSSSK